MKGQSLLEMVIALGIILAVISTLAIVTLNSMQNSQFSKNQVQATKLAQDGIDKVRSIKSRNYTVCGLTPTGKWNDFFTTKSCPTSADCRYIIRTTSACGGTDPVSLNASGTAEQVTLDGVNFQRTVTIVDFEGVLNRKEVTVAVAWTDISGTHNSKLVTVLTLY